MGGSLQLAVGYFQLAFSGGQYKLAHFAGAAQVVGDNFLDFRDTFLFHLLGQCPGEYNADFLNSHRCVAKKSDRPDGTILKIQRLAGTILLYQGAYCLTLGDDDDIRCCHNILWLSRLHRLYPTFGLLLHWYILYIEVTIVKQW